MSAKGPIFTSQEVHLLMDCLRQHHHIIESKVTNNVMNKDKEKAWAAVADEFNALGGGTFRSNVSLKNKWQLLKKAARREGANLRYEGSATGGGPCVTKDLSEISRRVLELASHLSILGSSGGPCSDGAHFSTTSEESEENSTPYLPNPMADSIAAPSIDASIQYVTEISNNEVFINPIGIDNNNTWNRYTPAMLKQPKNKKLSVKTPVFKKRNHEQYKINLNLKEATLKLQKEHIELMIAAQKKENEYKRIEHETRMACMLEQHKLKTEFMRAEHQFKINQ